MAKLHLFTFCVDIGRHDRLYLIQVLHMLIKSLNRHNNYYELIVFTNYDINMILDMGIGMGIGTRGVDGMGGMGGIDNNIRVDLNKPNIIFKPYFDYKENFFGDSWLNLNYNRINIYKYLYDTCNKTDYTWIDLDTIVCTNIEYINDVDNMFIINGGSYMKIETPFINDTSLKYGIPMCKLIQGNVWKLNIDLYNNLMATFKELVSNKYALQYDVQSLFNYYIYFKLGGLGDGGGVINIAGVNFKPETINGLSIHAPSHMHSHTHANENTLINLYYENGKLMTKYHPNKEIHFVSFTMYSLRPLLNTPKFNALFN